MQPSSMRDTRVSHKRRNDELIRRIGRARTNLRYDELIRLKRSSGCSEDLADIVELELIRENRKA
jgi:hypothetical protein